MSTVLWKQRAAPKKKIVDDASRTSHDTGILKFPTGPLVTPEKAFQKYFKRSPWALELYKRNKKEGFRALKNIHMQKKKKKKKRKAASEDQVLRGRKEQVWFLATCNQARLSGNPTIRHQNVFRDTEGALKIPKDTRWTGVAAHTPFHEGPGTQTWTQILCWATAPSPRGQKQPGVRPRRSERLPQSPWSGLRRGRTALYGSLLPCRRPERARRKPPLAHLPQALPFSGSEKAT